jgi:hypothetical protein
MAKFILDQWTVKIENTPYFKASWGILKELNMIIFLKNSSEIKMCMLLLQLHWKHLII